jgi:hypothetical protein
LVSLFAWSGTWGQPGANATGSGGLLRNGDKDINGKEISEAWFGGARTDIRVTDPGSEGGSCNTVALGWEEGHAGQLNVSFSRFKPGLYGGLVTITWATTSGAKVTVYVANDKGQLVANDWVSSGSGRKSYSGTLSFEVLVGASGSAWVARINPTVALGRGNRSAVGEIIVENIAKLEE